MDVPESLGSHLRYIENDKNGANRADRDRVRSSGNQPVTAAAVAIAEAQSEASHEITGIEFHQRADDAAALRDLFAAIFFLFFSFQIDPQELSGVLLPAVLLLVITGASKIVSGWVAAGRLDVSRRGRLRAGVTLIARGEFSIVIASLGVTLDDGSQLGILAAAYVLLTAVAGPLVAKHADAIYAILDRRRSGRETPGRRPTDPEEPVSTKVSD